MASPDQRLFDEDVSSAEFRIGEAKGFWGVSGADVFPTAGLAWPKTILWVGAPPRTGAPDRFHVHLDLKGYRTSPPTGAFWDPKEKALVPCKKWPKGKDGSRFAKVFRTDWKGGVAFYHPYDRVAAHDHNQWPAEQPHLIWTPNHTIVDYLEELHSLFSGEDYVGV